jgi:branched-subunit amino acid transport protein
MTEPQIWLIILGGMVTTYLTRLSFVALIPQERLPLRLRRALQYIPPAVLAAIVFPELAIRGGELAIAIENERLLAGLLAALVAWRLKNTWFTIASGMLALWLLTLA